MIKPEQIKQVETTRESVVRGVVYTTVDSLIIDEAQSYNGIEHAVRIPYNWEGFGTNHNPALEELEYNIRPIIKEYLEQFIEQVGVYDGGFYAEDGEFLLEYKVR